MLEQDRKQAGWSVAHAAWRLGVSIREYRELCDDACFEETVDATEAKRLRRAFGVGEGSRFCFDPSE